MLGPPVHFHAEQADSDGPGRNDDDSVAILLQLYGRLNNESEDRKQRLSGIFVDD